MYKQMIGNNVILLCVFGATVAAATIMLIVLLCMLFRMHRSDGVERNCEGEDPLLSDYTEDDKKIDDVVYR